MSRFVPKNGQYYYAPHRKMWGVFKRNINAYGIAIDDHIDDFADKADAIEMVCRLNHWTK